ncbi:hypothetical protein GOP47_0009136 [Adiantum capillus-veneris]|uniref:RING-type domain-containing protein n=1 Tax=Adiantum capillus-veneris TaxID=13818 RepID=A0A9D4UZL9_ADICA|nr:hypothetical protein GOP47_0009136 [Adiantum capillus-veneris]
MAYKWVDELDRRMLQQALSLAAVSSVSSNPRVFSAASSSTPPSAAFSSALDADDNDDLEDLCRAEFGLKLGKLKSRLRSQAEEQQASLHRFCTDVQNTPNAKLRRELAKSFIMDLASISELATSRYTPTLVKMQSTFLANVQVENETLAGDVSRFKNELADVKDALQRLEMEKQGIESEARRRFEDEKALLEVSLREELQACQVCLRNPRDIVIMPCLHGQFCGECLEAHQKTNRTCPTCRGVIRGTLPYIA